MQALVIQLYSLQLNNLCTRDASKDTLNSRRDGYRDRKL